MAFCGGGGALTLQRHLRMHLSTPSCVGWAYQHLVPQLALKFPQHPSLSSLTEAAAAACGNTTTPCRGLYLESIRRRQESVSAKKYCGVAVPSLSSLKRVGDAASHPPVLSSSSSLCVLPPNFIVLSIPPASTLCVPSRYVQSSSAECSSQSDGPFFSLAPHSARCAEILAHSLQRNIYDSRGSTHLHFSLTEASVAFLFASLRFTELCAPIRKLMKEKQLRQTDPNVHEEEEIAEVQKNAVPINFDLSPYYTDDMVRFQSYYSRCVCPSARVNACDGIGQYGSVLLDLPESFDIIGSHHAGVEVFVRNMADAAAASNSAARWLFPNIGTIPHGRTEREGGEFDEDAEVPTSEEPRWQVPGEAPRVVVRRITRRDATWQHVVKQACRFGLQVARDRLLYLPPSAAYSMPTAGNSCREKGPDVDPVLLPCLDFVNHALDSNCEIIRLVNDHKNGSCARNKQRFRYALRTKRAIRVGEELTVTYAPPPRSIFAIGSKTKGSVESYFDWFFKYGFFP